MSDRQYQSLSAPLVPQQPTDAVATDSWVPRIVDPMRRAASITVLAAISVAPLFVADVTDPAPALSWRGTAHPDRVWAVRLPRAAHLVTAQNVDPIQNPFFESGGKVFPTGSFHLWQYLGLVGPLDVPITTFPELSWQPTYPDTIRPPQGLRASLQRPWTIDQFDAPAAPTEAPDHSWDPVLPERPRAAIVQTYRAQVFAMDTQWTAPPISTSLIGWRVRYPDQHPPRRPLAPYIWAQPHFGVEIQIPVMSWTGWYLDPPVKPKPSRHAAGTRVTAPLYVADVTDPAPELSWKGSQPDRIARRVPPTDAKSVWVVFVADDTVTVPARSWSPAYPDRVWAKVSLQVSAQRAWTMDRITAPVIVAAPDLALPVYPDRVHAKPQPTKHPDAVAPEYVLDVTRPAPILSWAPSYPDAVRWALRTPERYPVTTGDPTTPAPRVFQAAWVHFNTYIGPFDEDLS